MTITIRLFGHNLLHFTIHNIMHLQYKDHEPFTSELQSSIITKENVVSLENGFISLSLLNHYLKYPDTIAGFLFTDNNSNIIGYIYVFKKGSSDVQYKIRNIDIYISDVFVYPKYRGNKYAKQMLSKVINDLHEDGYDDYYLACRTDNKNALHIYKSMNFKTVSRKLYLRILGRNIPYRNL